MFLGSGVLPARKANKLTSIGELIVQTVPDQYLTTL
jgi:hypothetical protein